MLAALFLDTPAARGDPVVPILPALAFFTLGAVIGRRLMTSLKQPAVLGELLVGALAGNLGYWLGNPELGKGIGVIDDGLFSAILILVMITTFLAPVLLRFSLGPDSFSPTQSARRA